MSMKIYCNDLAHTMLGPNECQDCGLPVLPPPTVTHRVLLPYAVFGIGVGDDRRVRCAAPIARWMVGKGLDEVRSWVEGKNGIVEALVEGK